MTDNEDHMASPIFRLPNQTLIVTPLGVTLEVHAHGIDVGLYLSTGHFVWANIDDVRGEIPPFHGREFAVKRTVEALAVMSQRYGAEAPETKGDGR